MCRLAQGPSTRPEPPAALSLVRYARGAIRRGAGRRRRPVRSTPEVAACEEIAAGEEKVRVRLDSFTDSGQDLTCGLQLKNVPKTFVVVRKPLDVCSQSVQLKVGIS